MHVGRICVLGGPGEGFISGLLAWEAMVHT